MTLTTDYSKMSDFEINKAVGLTVGYATGIEPCFEVVIINKTGRPFNPCNNPADAWPIIASNKITVCAPMDGDESKEWMCYDTNHSDTDFKDKNPLRAAMIVFLMMKERA